MKCERCGESTVEGSYELHDYCNLCSKNLCAVCMANGCCGITPAGSGSKEDDENGEETAERVVPWGGR